MTVSRNGKKLELAVDLQERTDDALALFNGGKGGNTEIGIQVEPLTEELARELNLPGPASGLLVTSVEDDSLAARGDMQVGDVIESAAGQPLQSAEQFNDVLSRAKQAGRGLQMVIRRGNVKLLVVIR